MIHIEQNQLVPENEDLRVLSVSGDYNDNDLIECCHISNPGFALYAFSATFIKYGGVVYQYSDPLLLGKALLEIDPDCTHDYATLFKEEEARRVKREEGDFTPEAPVPVDESISPIAQTEALVEEEVINNEEIPVVENNPTPEVVAPVTETVETSTSTTTADEIINNLETVNQNVSEIIDVANKSQEIIDALTEAPIN